MCDNKICLCLRIVPIYSLILDNCYITAVCTLTGELGEEMELVSTAFTKNLTLPPQVILARVLSDSAGRIKPSL